MSDLPLTNAFMKTRELQDEFDGLTAEQIRNMPLSEFGRRTNREFLPASNAVVARKLDPVLVDYTQNAALFEEVQVEEMPEPEPVSVRDMSYEEYAAFRAQAGIGQGEYGRGALDGASHDAWVAAAARKSGRNGMVTRGVVESPAISRVTQPQVNEGNLDRRPLAERFGTASNAYRYEG